MRAAVRVALGRVPRDRGRVNAGGARVAVFARREKLGFWRRVGRFASPPGGLARAWRYLLHRVKRLPATPHAIAAGFAAGAAMSCLPLIGLHFLLSFALAWIVRGSMVAAALGTAVGNPLTFPFLYALAYRVGVAMLGAPVAADEEDAERAAAIATEVATGGEGLDLQALAELWPTFAATFVGALPVALAMFVLWYVPLRALVARFQAARRARLARRLRDGAGAGDGNRTRISSLEG